jgi:hypothetical protein
MPMSSLDGSDLRPFWQFRHAGNRQAVTFADAPMKKMLLYDEKSRNVYENKQNRNKTPDEVSDIYVEMTRILQKIAGFGRQFAVNGMLGPWLCGSSRRQVPVCRRVGKRLSLNLPRQVYLAEWWHKAAPRSN